MKHFIPTVTALAMITVSVKAELGDKPNRPTQKQFDVEEQEYRAIMAEKNRRFRAFVSSHPEEAEANNRHLEAYWARQGWKLDNPLGLSAKLRKKYSQYSELNLRETAAKQAQFDYDENPSSENWYHMRDQERQVRELLQKMKQLEQPQQQPLTDWQKAQQEVQNFQKSAQSRASSTTSVDLSDLPTAKKDIHSFYLDKSVPTKAQTSEPDVSDIPDALKQKNDCVLVAKENLKRLGPISFWAKELQFTYFVDGKMLEMGHDVVAWKDKPTSYVNVIDADGTYTFLTKSTDSKEILRLLGAQYSKITNRTVTLKGAFNDEVEHTIDAYTKTAASTPVTHSTDPPLWFLALLGLMGFGVGAAFYFLPTLIAVARKRFTFSVFAWNLLAGWLVVGWLFVLVWSLRRPRSSGTPPPLPASIS
jgi:hypothetical protein